VILIPEELSIYEPDEKLIQKMEKNELKEKVLFQADSDFHSISVVETKIGKFIKFQDTYQAGYIKTKEYEGNLPYINYFLIPSLMNKNIKNILLIGFGSGVLVNQFEKIFSKLEKIDVVDIDENIFEIAQKYFNFKKSDKINLYLQDALIYLRSIKKKYDLIIVDVADNIGVDERFCNEEYLELIKKHLKKDGIFISNLPSSRDIFNKKNKIPQKIIKDYKNIFENVSIYNGETSNKIFYKLFFNMDEIVFDITNMILISSNKKWKISNDFSEIKKLKVKIEDYLDDIL